MRTVDLAIIAAYLAGVTWFGARFKQSQRTLKDYFLGGQTAPWWAIALSIVSAETSTLTIIGTPPLAYSGSYVFLQVVFGYLLARVVISTIFLPRYFERQIFTAYELMQRRFGPNVRKVASGIFLVTRALAEGVRVFAISIVISIILKTGGTASIALIMALTLFYTFEGGMTAVIWTDVVQMCLYVFGAVLSLIVILGKIPGGWPHAVAVAGAAHKFAIFDFHFAPTMEFFARPYTFWAGIVGGCFLTTASHGTDQLMVQRLLSARGQRDSRKALLASWALVAFQFTLFLLIGILLWVYYGGLGQTAPAADRIYPQFLWSSLPPGLAGLAIAAILAAAMANLSAALNALSSTVVVDFLGGGAGSAGEAGAMRRARLATVAWAAVLVGIGYAARHSHSVLEAGLTIASIPSGALLGVFLLGVLTRRPGERAAIAGVVAGLTAALVVRFETPVAFTWYVMIGATVTFSCGLAASWLGRALARMR